MAKTRQRGKTVNDRDPFGLGREERILQSKVREVFTPHQPIDQIGLLFGREKEVQKLVENVNTPGQHVLLFGDRGVGKSSLANVARFILLNNGRRQGFVKRCDSEDTFETIVQAPLRAIGADLQLETVAKGRRRSRDIGVEKGVVARFGRSSEIVETFKTSGTLSPSIVAEALQALSGLLVVDEADAIAKPKDKRKLAELIKHLSDNGSPFKIMVVGIAETGDELTAAHPSVERCLKETHLNRMSSDELLEIILNGSEKLELKFTRGASRAIVRLSSGYPYFTHLLSLKCAEEAIAGGYKEISMEDLEFALQAAVEEAEGALKRRYNDGIRSSGTDLYRVILMAAATIGQGEFSAQGLREAITAITGETISQGSLNNYFKRLVSTDGSTVLRRVGKGFYRFEDPRMLSYVRIANAMLEENDEGQGVS